MDKSNSAYGVGRLPRAGRGLTTLELLLALAISGVPAAYVGQKPSAQANKPAAAATRPQFEPAEKAPDRYRLDDRRCAGNGQGLVAPALPPMEAGEAPGLNLKRYVSRNAACSPYALRVTRS